MKILLQISAGIRSVALETIDKYRFGTGQLTVGFL